MGKSIITSVVLLILSSNLVYAFQQEPIGSLPQKPAAKSEKPSGEGLQVRQSEQNKTKGKSGIEINIPGIGKLGVLPKLDFGLELLYGANEPKATEEQSQTGDDVRIRGSVKHRF